MKPAVVADEMFPEGAGPYMDLEEVSNKLGKSVDKSYTLYNFVFRQEDLLVY